MRTGGPDSGWSKWPRSQYPDDPTVLSIAAVVDEHVDVSADSPQLPLHTHPTGQLALSVGGLVGLQLESGYWSIPALCAIWVPPGVPHTGVLGLDGRSVYFHVGPSQLEGFPDYREHTGNDEEGARKLQGAFSRSRRSRR